ncbi:MAG TPA: hypothetical protein VFH47_01835 [Candidatus Thermoplasmatota archaeon]|nr:hypothetical protein [Candidatus Thermoplasmatota archaeon]
MALPRVPLLVLALLAAAALVPAVAGDPDGPGKGGDAKAGKDAKPGKDKAGKGKPAKDDGTSTKRGADGLGQAGPAGGGADGRHHVCHYTGSDRDPYDLRSYRSERLWESHKDHPHDRFGPDTEEGCDRLPGPRETTPPPSPGATPPAPLPADGVGLTGSRQGDVRFEARVPDGPATTVDLLLPRIGVPWVVDGPEGTACAWRLERLACRLPAGEGRMLVAALAALPAPWCGELHAAASSGAATATHRIPSTCPMETRLSLTAHAARMDATGTVELVVHAATPTKTAFLRGTLPEGWTAGPGCHAVGPALSCALPPLAAGESWTVRLQGPARLPVELEAEAFAPGEATPGDNHAVVRVR